jgi:hypothetical protein
MLTADNKTTQQDMVVLVPGIYMPGFSLSLLARRLRQMGFQTAIFAYPSLRLSVAENAANLYQTTLSLNTTVAHFVGHSLGGLLIRTLMANHAHALPPGNTVTLGTPHTGSKVAWALQHHKLGGLLGRSREQGLLGDIPNWPTERTLGSLAGQYRYGLGRVLTKLDWPHDGTVEVSETVFPQLSDQIHLPVSHTALLINQQVVYQTAYFLRHQQFDHSSPAKC